MLLDPDDPLASMQGCLIGLIVSAVMIAGGWLLVHWLLS